jgi:hypothetical protein
VIDPGMRADGRLVSAGGADAVSATGRSPSGVTVNEFVFKAAFSDMRTAAGTAWHPLLNIHFLNSLAPAAKQCADER